VIVVPRNAVPIIRDLAMMTGLALLCAVDVVAALVGVSEAGTCDGEGDEVDSGEGDAEGKMEA
jgi:hypothetical protein